MFVTGMPGELEQAHGQGLVLKLFVAGGRPESALAVDRLRKILKEHDIADGSLQIFDIEQRPQIAREAQVVVVPTLVREFPLPRKILVGDLSQVASIFESFASFPPSQESRGEVPAPWVELPPYMVYPNQKTVRVLLVGFSRVVHSGLREMLSHSHWIELVPEATDESQLLPTLGKADFEGHPIHLVLTESAQSATSIKAQFPKTAVLVLFEHLDPTALIEMIAAGAAGYMALNELSASRLLEAIRGKLRSEVQIQTSVLSEAVNALLDNDWRMATARLGVSKHLSEREAEVLRLLAHGDSNKAIAETLGMTLNTTKKHVGNVIRKLSARNRTHAAVIALQMAAGRPPTQA